MHGIFLYLFWKMMSKEIGIIRRQFVNPFILKEYVLLCFVLFNMANEDLTFLPAVEGTKYLFSATQNIILQNMASLFSL